MLSAEMAEKNSGQSVVTDIEPDVMAILVDHVYSAKKFPTDIPTLSHYSAHYNAESPAPDPPKSR